MSSTDIGRFNLPQIQNASPKSSRQTVSHWVDMIGTGQYQLLILFLGGGVYIADGAMLLIAGSVARGLSYQWELSYVHSGAITSFLFIGMMLGNFVGGTLSDQHGRRPLILWSYGGILVFGMFSIVSWGFSAMLINKLMLGIMFGIGLPAANAIVCETSPSYQRSNYICMMSAMFALGQMYSAIVIWLVNPSIDVSSLNWRLLIFFAILPTLLLYVCARKFLLESPHFLVGKDMPDEAIVVLKHMAALNGKEDIDVQDHLEALSATSHSLAKFPSFSDGNLDSARGTNFVVYGAFSRMNSGTPQVTPRSGGPNTARRSRVNLWSDVTHWVSSFFRKTKSEFDFSQNQIVTLFNEFYIRFTVTMSVACVSSNLYYFGLIFSLPDTFEEIHRKGGGGLSPAAGVFFAAVFEIPGAAMALVLGLTLSRRSNLMICFGGSAVFGFVLAAAMVFPRLLFSVIPIAAFAGKVFITSAFIVTYLYLLEGYPTMCRATGLAFCAVVGKFGAIICPMLFHLSRYAGSLVWYYFLLSVSASYTAYLIKHKLPLETKDEPLCDLG